MKIAILYHSQHHENTKKLVDALASESSVDVFRIPGTENIDLSSYDLIGFASGIYLSRFHDSLFEFVRAHTNALANKRVFLLFTSGSGGEKYHKSFSDALQSCGCDVCGYYHCRGFDTFGPWKLIGGIAKGHPNAEDIKEAKSFFTHIQK